MELFSNIHALKTLTMTLSDGDSINFSHAASCGVRVVTSLISFLASELGFASVFLYLVLPLSLGLGMSLGFLLGLGLRLGLGVSVSFFLAEFENLFLMEDRILGRVERLEATELEDGPGVLTLPVGDPLGIVDFSLGVFLVPFCAMVNLNNLTSLLLD